MYINRRDNKEKGEKEDELEGGGDSEKKSKKKTLHTLLRDICQINK